MTRLATLLFIILSFVLRVGAIGSLTYTFGELHPIMKELGANSQKYSNVSGWSILDYQNSEVTAYYIKGGTMNIVRFDEKFYVTAKQSIKVTSILRVYKSEKVYEIFAQGNILSNITYYVVDRQTLEILEKKKFVVDDGQGALSISCSDNGKYYAIVTKTVPQQGVNPFGVKSSYRYRFNYYLFNKDFSLLGSGSFTDDTKSKVFSTWNYCYANSWLLTDEGELVFANFKFVNKDKLVEENTEEFGASRFKLDVCRYTVAGGLKVQSVPNVQLPGVPYSYILNLKGADILGYDGHEMKIYFLNLLYHYSFDENKVTTLAALPRYVATTMYSTGLSGLSGDGKGNYIINFGDEWVWIKPNPAESVIGSWYKNERFKNRSWSGLNFIYNHVYYRIQGARNLYDSSRFVGEPEYVSVLKDGREYDDIPVAEDRLCGYGEKIYHYLSPGKYLVWHRLINTSEGMMQRLGTLIVEDDEEDNE